MDGTGLEPDTCDMAFISKTYHHLDKDKHIDYLKHLKQVIKPSGTLVIIERHPALATGRGKDHTWPPGLLGKQAEDAGWMLLTCDLIPSSDHYMAIFVQPESFAEEFEKRKNAPITAQEEEYNRIQKTPREPDVVYVPTPQHVVDKMLEMAQVTKDDLLYDLGCGDGRIVVTAAKKYGCRAVGYDIARRRVKESMENVRKNNIGHLVSIEQKDIFSLDISNANVVTLYLLPELNVKLIPQLEKLEPGSRIVSHDFDMEGVTPDKVITIEDNEDDYGDHTIYLWTIPLKKE
jgi:ubiquinone/menaquinone biosynthesis C-methylase UbiE